MKRRRFLTGSALTSGAIIATSALPAPALSKNRLSLSLVTSWPKDFPGLGGSANRFAETVNTLSENRINITVFGGGKKVHSLKCNDAVQQGAADIYHSFDHYFDGKAAAYRFFTSVPFGLTTREYSAWISQGGGQEIWDAIGGEFGVKHLMGGNTGPQLGGWFKKPVKAAADFTGHKVASAGFSAAVLRALGGTPILMSGAEIQQALLKNTIDGAEWAGPWADYQMGFQKAVKNMHFPGLHQPGSMFSIGISRKLWDRLPPADQALFHAAAAQTSNETIAAFTAKSALALKSLRDEHDVTLVEFDDMTSKKIAAVAGDVLSATAAADPLSKKAFASFMAFRKSMLDWTGVAERSFLNQRGLLKA